MVGEESLKNMSVRIDRIREDILQLASIGRSETDHGIYRMAFTQADMEARDWLEKKMQGAGLTTRRDGAANVCGELKAESGAPRVIVGSHIDTVPCAGTLDGTVGVIAGLECLRVVREAGLPVERTLELIAFTDEEGRFGGMLGSQSLCGLTTPDTVYHAADLDGNKLHDVMVGLGLEPMRILEARREPESIDAYLELHIEQGPVLDHYRKQVGIVDEITGLTKWVIRLKGTANQAGTTPMEMRNDAFMGLADFAHEISRILEENGSDRSRATIGRVQILPGAPNTVPGLVEFSLDLRDTNEAVLEELGDAIRRTLSAISRRKNLMFEFEVQSRIQPVACAKRLTTALESNARQLGLEHLVMPSGAAHDAQIVARIAPVAMIFVPSKDCKSHSPAEWTAWSDIEAGANLLLHTLIQLAS